MKRFLCRKEEFLSKSFYNIKADLKEQPKPFLHPGTKQPITPDDLAPLFPMGFIMDGGIPDRYIPIPEEVREKMALYRPTSLIYASGLKKYLDTPADIFYKYEGTNPMGSHKINTALMQAYHAAKEGVRGLCTETGAGQWGSALSYAGQMFGLDIEVFMVRTSFRSKPGRKIVMEMNGARVHESPSNLTDSGKKYYNEDPNHPGSLGIAISEAVETAVKGKGIKYSLGSVLDGVLLHQTVIGQEALLQLNDAGAYPDVVIGAVGGGSNFAGITFPFLKEVLTGGKKTRFIAVEPEACPSMTKGELKYDFGDSIGSTPLIYMHTLGKDFIPAPIHAGGLRYHGMAPLVSHLANLGFVNAVAVNETKVFDAAKTFVKTEGLIPAPESSHAIAVVIEEALKAKKENKKINILFNCSGHGMFDMAAFDKHIK